MLIPNSPGGYSFLSGSATYSSGALAAPGYVMARATFFRPVPVAQAFAKIEEYLTSIGRPMAAVAGLELRSPKPFTFESFGGFNATYIDLLKRYGLHLDGKGMATRSNLAPEPLDVAPSEPAIYAFTYTMPGTSPRPQFVASGSGELKPASQGKPDGAPRDLIVRLGETTPDAMREKAIYCMDAVAAELTGMGVSWADCTGVNIYTVYGVDSYLLEDVIKPIGAASIHGVHWYFTRPPIEEIEFEVDARGVSQEIIL